MNSEFSLKDPWEKKLVGYRRKLLSEKEIESYCGRRTQGERKKKKNKMRREKKI